MFGPRIAVPFCNHLTGKETAGCFTLIAFLYPWLLVFRVSFRGAVSWSAVCDCGICWSYSITFSYFVHFQRQHVCISSNLY